MILLIALLAIEEVHGTPSGLAPQATPVGGRSTNRKVTFFGSLRLKTYVPLRVFVDATALNVTPFLPLKPAYSTTATPLGAVPATVRRPARRKYPRRALIRLSEML